MLSVGVIVNNYYKLYKTVNLLKEKSLTIGLILAGLLIGIGFLISPAKSSHYGPLLDVADSMWWGLLFIGYGLFKLSEIFYRVWAWLKVVATVAATWLWFYLLLSLTVYDTRALNPTDLLLVLPILAELFELSFQFYWVKANRSLK